MRVRVVTAILAASITLQAAPRAASAQQPAPAADGEGRERSRAAFRKGVSQLRAQDWAAARASFESAWSLYPHPSILLNLGIARLRTDDPVRAEQDFVRFLSEDFGASPEELAAAREALAEVRAKLGTLKVVVSPASARVQLDGKAVETVRRADPSAGTQTVVAEARVKPGRHAVAVEAEGFTAESRDVDVAAKGEATVNIALAPVPDAIKKPPAEERTNVRAVVGWTFVGLAGASLATGVICAVNARSLADDYADPASPGFQDPGTRSEGVTFRTTADVAFGLTIAAGVTAALLLLTDIGRGTADVARVNRPRPFGPLVLRW